MRWIHHDPRLNERATRQAAAHASGLPVAQPRDEAAADLRAWLADRAYLLARLVGTVDVSGEYATIDPVHDGASGERLEAARALYAPCVTLARELGQVVPRELETRAPGGSVEVGALPAIAVVAIALGSVVAIGLLANQASTVIDRALERSEATRRMLAKDTAARAVVEAHLAREEKAGKAIPLDDSERQVLADLSEQSKAAAAALPAYPSVLSPELTRAPGLGLGIGAGSSIVLLAAAAAVWMFLRTAR